MSLHLHREIELLKKRIINLSAVVEDNLDQAVRAVQERSESVAQQVIDTDVGIDESEVTVEEECLKLLALYQPVAVDLRYIVAVMKLNNDLERIGDLAVNIAERAFFLSRMTVPEQLPHDFKEMATKVRTMVKRALDALVNLDVGVAKVVCADDDEIDGMHREFFTVVKSEAKKNPEQLDALLELLSVSRCLERIADHATNIAEDVIYLIDGGIVRHQRPNL